MAIESIKEAVGTAIARASQATGVDFGYLMRTARRESGFNPSAKAQSSSAGGLFQFVDQTWLGALKQHGAKHGYSAFANLIKTASDGRLSVAGGGDARKEVMALRMDPKASSLMAGELASDNAAYLRGRVGREPTAGELYAAHFLGPKASADLIEAYQHRPGTPAAALFPDAAAANPAIFYRDGRAASVSEIYANLTRGQSEGSGAAASIPTPVSFIHFDTRARLARLEQEHQLTDMLLGLSSKGQGQSPSGAQSLTGSLFSSEMLSLLSQARHAEQKT
jgi:hypothetical protein